MEREIFPELFKYIFIVFLELPVVAMVSQDSIIYIQYRNNSIYFAICVLLTKIVQQRRVPDYAAKNLN